MKHHSVNDNDYHSHYGAFSIMSIQKSNNPVKVHTFQLNDKLAWPLFGRAYLRQGS